MLQDLQERRYSDPKLKESLNNATFLDPRFKANYVNRIEQAFLEDEVADNGMNLVTRDVQHTHQDPEPSGVAVFQPPGLPPPKKKKLATLLKERAF